MRTRTTTPLPPAPQTPFPVADRARTGELYETEHPRLAAIRHLRELIADHRAGLDPHDETVFVLDVRPHEQVWARSVVELTGLFLSEIRNASGGFCRYRMILEADIRAELGLDRLDAPFLDSEESDGEVVDLFEARELALAEQRLDHPSTPLEHAIADARDAHERMQKRQVH